MEPEYTTYRLYCILHAAKLSELETIIDEFLEKISPGDSETQGTGDIHRMKVINGIFRSPIIDETASKPKYTPPLYMVIYQLERSEPFQRNEFKIGGKIDTIETAVNSYLVTNFESIFKATSDFNVLDFSFNDCFQDGIEYKHNFSVEIPYDDFSTNSKAKSLLKLIGLNSDTNKTKSVIPPYDIVESILVGKRLVVLDPQSATTTEQDPTRVIISIDENDIITSVH